MSIWRDMTDPWPTEPPSSLPCPVCGGPVDYDARGLEEYKQLRAERDRYRDRLAISPGGDDAIDGLSDAVSQLREAESRLTAERDAARLELRALEWLQESEWGFGIHWGRHAGTIWTRPRRDEPRSDLHANWSEAARELGWEG